MKKLIISISIPLAILATVILTKPISLQAASFQDVVNMLVRLGIIPSERADEASKAVSQIDSTPQNIPCFAFTRNLSVGDSGVEVENLTSVLVNQGLLNTKSNVYDEVVASAVAKYQEKYASEILAPNGLGRGTGYLGGSTRARLNRICPGNSQTNRPDTINKGTSSTTATIDRSSLTSSSNTPTISGYAYNVAQPFGISISNTGGKVWSSGNIVVSNSRWTTTVNQNLPADTYSVQIYSNNTLLATETLTITSSTPTCSLLSNKSSYKIGETIIYYWTSQNATYASWKQDTSGKDYLSLPGDKLPANGTQQVIASVVGNPSVTLMVGGSGGTGSCSTSVTVTAEASNSATINKDTLKVSPGSSFTLTGKTSTRNSALTVVIVGPGYVGETNWDRINTIIKSDAGLYTGFSKKASLSGANWSASFNGLVAEGYYTVFVYDASNNLIGTGSLWVTFKG